MTATEVGTTGPIAEAVRRAVDAAPPLPTVAVAVLQATGLRPRVPEAAR